MDNIDFNFNKITKNPKASQIILDINLVLL